MIPLGNIRNIIIDADTGVIIPALNGAAIDFIDRPSNIFIEEIIWIIGTLINTKFAAGNLCIPQRDLIGWSCTINSVFTLYCAVKNFNGGVAHSVHGSIFGLDRHVVCQGNGTAITTDIVTLRRLNGTGPLIGVYILKSAVFNRKMCIGLNRNSYIRIAFQGLFVQIQYDILIYDGRLSVVCPVPYVICPYQSNTIFQQHDRASIAAFSAGHLESFPNGIIVGRSNGSFMVTFHRTVGVTIRQGGGGEQGQRHSQRQQQG